MPQSLSPSSSLLIDLVKCNVLTVTKVSVVASTFSCYNHFAWCLQLHSHSHLQLVWLPSMMSWAAITCVYILLGPITSCLLASYGIIISLWGNSCSPVSSMSCSNGNSQGCINGGSQPSSQCSAAATPTMANGSSSHSHSICICSINNNCNVLAVMKWLWIQQSQWQQLTVDDDFTWTPMTIIMVFISRKFTILNWSKVVDRGNALLYYSPNFALYDRLWAQMSSECQIGCGFVSQKILQVFKDHTQNQRECWWWPYTTPNDNYNGVYK